MQPTITFCNDIDFADWATYREVHRIFSQEFGIEAEDSFWLFDRNGSEMALFRNSIKEKGPYHDELLEDIKNSKLTILHGAGDFSKTNTSILPARDLISEGLDYLKERALVPEIWTNHGDEGDIQNIGGAKATYQQGDDPSSEVYVLDILLQYGIKFLWTDNYSTNTFVLSNQTESENPLLVKERSRSGHEITCFYRYRGALSKAPDAQTLGRQVTREHLDKLVQLSGVSIIYQHWCVHRNGSGIPHTASMPVFPKESLNALKLLAEYRDQNGLRIMTLTKCLEEYHSKLYGRIDEC